MFNQILHQGDRTHGLHSSRFVMAARKHTQAVVKRYVALIDGRPAFYTIDWNGVESDLRIVGEDETEFDVIRELNDELEASHPSLKPSSDGKRRRGPLERPLLRLL